MPLTKHVFGPFFPPSTLFVLYYQSFETKYPIGRRQTFYTDGLCKTNGTVNLKL